MKLVIFPMLRQILVGCAQVLTTPSTVVSSCRTPTAQHLQHWDHEISWRISGTPWVDIVLSSWINPKSTNLWYPRLSMIHWWDPLGPRWWFRSVFSCFFPIHFEYRDFQSCQRGFTPATRLHFEIDFYENHSKQLRNGGPLKLICVLFTSFFSVAGIKYMGYPRRMFTTRANSTKPSHHVSKRTLMVQAFLIVVGPSINRCFHMFSQ